MMKKLIILILVVDYKNHGMRLRVNFGIEWGRLLNGKKKIHKGYRPVRRVVQVIGVVLV